MPIKTGSGDTNKQAAWRNLPRIAGHPANFQIFCYARKRDIFHQVKKLQTVYPLYVMGNASFSIRILPHMLLYHICSPKYGRTGRILRAFAGGRISYLLNGYRDHRSWLHLFIRQGRLAHHLSLHIIREFSFNLDIQPCI